MRLVLLLLLSTLFRCSPPPTYFAPQLVEAVAKFARSADGLPPAPFCSSLFVRTDTRGIGQTDLRALYHAYQAGYTQQYATFPAFLDDALNQRVAVASALLPRHETFFFLLDSAVVAHYARLSPAALASAVCNPSGSEHWTLKSDVAHAPGRQTILYYLFLRNYGVCWDDPGAYYAIRKGLIAAPKRL
jgi:hypothetical protein